MFGWIKRSLFWQLFFSYLIVVLAGMIVLVVSIRAYIPGTFAQHFDDMRMAMMGGPGNNMMGGGMNNVMMPQFYLAFNKTVNDAVIIAFLTAIIGAVGVSGFVSLRLSEKVKVIIGAVERIASGKYSERVSVPEYKQINELDELGRLAFRFNQMAESLENTEIMRRQLIADVSHELRTPLTTIKGSMEGLLDGVLTGTQADYQLIYHEAARLQRLVEDLQELSKVEANAYTLNLTSTSIAGLINSIQTTLNPLYLEKGVQLISEVQQALPDIRIDEDRISQVLINLCSNALQFTEKGGKVILRVLREDNRVVFEVQDNGVGIPKEHLEHIFTRFYRVDPSRSRAFGGSGIGLTISKALVEAHHGEIFAKSAGLGKGSSFIFWLPIL